MQYDSLLKYCKKCKLKGYDEQECRVLHLKLIVITKIADEEGNDKQDATETRTVMVKKEKIE